MTWTGVFPAVTTKMDASGTIDFEATQASLDRLIGNGVSGVIVLPMLGENAALTQAERDAVVRAAKEVVAGRVPLLSGLAELSTDNAIAAARNYQKLGAEGLMVFPSLAYRTDRRETAAWYKAVAGASDLPVMIYNNPLAYKVDVDVETLKMLEDVPGIVAVKEETGDIRRVTDLFNAFGDRFDIFCGVDDLILESLALGVVGWVSGMTNAWPAECVKLFETAKRGDFASALPLYRLLTPAFHLDTDVKLVQYIKLAEHLVYGAPEHVRLPRLPVVGEERARAEAIISDTIASLKKRS
ncbi:MULTISPECIES: dihydrodipicolinate synthase family protein [Phyllobacteriaceae]|jgi:4-hydroxy-tetrahydrodipicolinate synthase|uniref:Dihydrodipicolinate synthase family protein n=1 Tax=Mesorhizobium hungaricum TaxID=1566387 RepID=A0A1C2DK62_9HYPH|nr:MULTISPECIES: dihydrodipicolinate synthase family protein [Mesorhizobium]MBN9233483.1 dihydrodipicolinate synthase family protein [Mesorhizobium sp.]MDQ0331827.1 4-hydroxy-tetrahydrodipicolinate synthase [Mesorhizobium sp. YL-MeA3-2017]OCX15053.1 dihydrodipicolinate synthase family protein [Mesorhizobium hungaricum]